MELVQKLSLLTVRHLLAEVCAPQGEGGRARLAELLEHGDTRLAAALAHAHVRAWRAVEIALAGEPFWDGCTVFLSPEECKALRAEVEVLRDHTPLAGRSKDAASRRRQALHELHRAQQAGLLAESAFNVPALAQSLRADAPGQRLSDELRRADYPALAALLAPRRPDELPLVVAALHHFLRRELSAAPDLLQGLRLDTARPLPEVQEAALARVGDVMAAHGRGLQEWLAEEESETPTPPPTPGAAAPQPDAGRKDPPTKRPGLWAWLGTAAVLVVPVLLVLWVVGGYSVTEERRFVSDGSPVYSVAFIPPDGVQVLSGHGNGIVRQWNVQTGEETRVFRGLTNLVRGLAVSPDGRLLLARDQKAVVLVDLKTGKPINSLPLPDTDVTVVLAFDKPRAAGRSHPVAQVIAAQGLALQGLASPAVPQAVVSLRVAAIPASALGQVPTPLAVMAVPAGQLVEQKTGRVVNTPPLVEIWDVGPPERLGSLAVGPDPAVSMALSSDARYALLGEKGSAALWDLKTGKEKARLQSHTGAVTAVAFSPEGKQVVTAGVDETVRLWDLEKGKEIRALGKTASPVVALALDPAGKRLLSGASARKGDAFDPRVEVTDRRPLRLWDVATGRDLALFQQPHGTIWSVAFSPDGTRALSGGEDGVVRLWPLPK
jgi:WD40 repeat protein